MGTRTRGREAVLDAVLAALDEPRGAAIACVHVHGVAGIGKTSLVDEVIDVLRAGRTHVSRLATDGLEPRALTLETALLAARAPLSEGTSRRVLVADPFDHLMALAPFLLRRIADPDLAFDGVVLVTRGALSPSLRATGAPGVAITSIEVSALARDAALALLADHGVPDEARETIVARIGGHPLSLCLIAATFDLATQEEPYDASIGHVLSEAAERLVDHVPSIEHERALLTAAIVPTLDDALLDAQLESVGANERRDIRRWLTDLPFVRARRRGYVMHDVVRSVLLEAGQAHDAALVRQMYRRTFAVLSPRRRFADPTLAEGAIDALSFMIMRHPLIRATFAASELAYRVEVPTAEQRDVALATIARVEGPHASALVARWLDIFGVETSAVLDEDQNLRGFFMMLGPEALLRVRDVDDPVADALVTHADTVAPSSRRLLTRAWFALEGYQDPRAPWSSVVNRAMTRASLRIAPTFGATCHRHDPLFRPLIDSCFTRPRAGVISVAVERDAPLAIAYRFAQPEDGDESFWGMLWSEPLGPDTLPPSDTPLPEPRAPLSERERDVLRLLADGYRYEQIASLLELSLGTVRTYVRRTYTKLGVSTKSEATLLALRLGILR